MNETTRKAITSSVKMDWGTPQALFDGLAKRFGPFDLDAAADKKNAKCASFYTEEDSALGEDADWAAYSRVWLNPPYGRNIGKWLRKAADEAEKGCRVVCLVPSRTGSRWFNEASRRASEILFIVGRITFDGAPSPAPFDSAVIVFEPGINPLSTSLFKQVEHGDAEHRAWLKEKLEGAEELKGPKVSWISREELLK